MGLQSESVVVELQKLLENDQPRLDQAVFNLETKTPDALAIAGELVRVLATFSEYLPYCSQLGLQERDFIVKTWRKITEDPELGNVLIEAVANLSTASYKEPDQKILMLITLVIKITLDTPFDQQISEVVQNSSLVSHLRALGFSNQELIEVVIGHRFAKKMNSSAPTLFEERILSCNSKEVALSLIDAAKKGTLTVPAELKAKDTLTRPSNAPLIERIRLTSSKLNNNSGELSVLIECIPNEKVEIISPSGASKKITELGSYSLDVQTDSIIRSTTHKGKTTLLFTNEGPVFLANSTDKSPVVKVMQKVSDQIWQEHENSLLPAQIAIIHAVAECARMLEFKKNSGLHLSKLHEKLTESEKKGFPPELSVEVLDVLTGHSTGGLLLEPRTIAAIEKKRKLTTKQWSELLAAAGSQEKLEILLGTWFSRGVLTQEEAREYLESSAEATPGHNIAELAKLLGNSLENNQEKGAAERITSFCYAQKALPKERQLTYLEFRKKTVELAFPSFNQSEGITVKSELLSRTDTQELTIRWLHAEVTNSFHGLLETQMRTACKLNLQEKTGIAKRDYTKLRYDVEQNSLILSFSLSEIMPPELHRYLQVKTQQGSFFTEYALPLAGRKNLSSLSEILQKKTEKNTGHLEAQQVQEALFECIVTDQKLSEESAALQDLLRVIVERHIAAKYSQISVAEKQQKILLMTTRMQAILLGSEGLARQQELVANILSTESTAAIAAVTQQLLQEQFSQASVVVTALHGWGANSENIMPFLDSIAEEYAGQGKTILVAAQNYMGASGSNQFFVSGLKNPATFAHAGQTLTETYGGQFVPIMHKLNGGSSEEQQHVILGHSMGGHVAIAAATTLGLLNEHTQFVALQPVISNREGKVLTKEGELISHYIALLGTESEEDGDRRPLGERVAATLNKVVTDQSPDSLLSGLNELLVFFGRVGINKVAYAQLVKNSDPRVANAHGLELAQWRASFHTHVTQLLQDIRSFTLEEKQVLAELATRGQFKVVLTTEDAVLKWIIGFHDFYDDPNLSSKERVALIKALLMIIGNHYGHLQPDNQKKVAGYIAKSEEQID